MTLTKIKCPGCGEFIFPKNGIIKTTNSYDDLIHDSPKINYKI
jgi:hypothetical protein